MAQNWTDDCFSGGHAGQTDLQNMENNFQCLKSLFSGTGAPSNPVAGMWWFDTTANILKLRNEANDAWLSVWDLANNKPVITNLSNEITAAMVNATYKNGAAGVACLRTLGSASGTACAGDDSRLSVEKVPRNKQVFTSSGSFSVPSGLVWCMVTLVGGGGGGAGGNDAGADFYGGSGGGAGEVICAILDVSGLSTITVTIGAAGSAGAADANGGNGGNTTFGSLLTAHGGSGGECVSEGVAAGGSGGAKTLISTNTNILFSFDGQRGGDGGNYIFTDWLNVTFSEGFGGFGGSPAMGFGTGGGGSTSTGNAGSGYGAGGQGGRATISSQYAGGAGTKGVCIVRY